MENSSYQPHKILLFSLFMLGETVIVLPFENSSDKTIIAIIAASLIGIPLLYLIHFLLSKANRINHFRKTVTVIICSTFTIYSLYLAINAFKVFMGFVSAYVLVGVSKLLAALVFFSVVIVLSLAKSSILYKFGIVTGILSIVMIIALFCFSWGQFSIDNVSLLSIPRLDDVFSESLGYFKSLIFPSLILLLFEEGNNKNTSLRATVSGYLLGLVLHLVCLLNSLLIFGTELSAKFSYAYSEAIATVTAGNIFTRMDGFSYFVFYITCLIKITVCLNLSLRLIKKSYYIIKNEVPLQKM